jgi:hypothetical protein
MVIILGDVYINECFGSKEESNDEGNTHLALRKNEVGKEDQVKKDDLAKEKMGRR